MKIMTKLDVFVLMFSNISASLYSQQTNIFAVKAQVLYFIVFNTN